MALAVAPGLERDDHLVAALADGGTLLEDEQEAEWALRPRERLDWLRQEARLALARDRTRGEGRSHPDAVVTAWEECLEHDATSEEAATALMRVYQAQGRHALERSTYHRCRDALEALGLRVSPALQQVHAVSGGSPDRAQDVSAGLLAPVAGRQRDERRLVSVLFADLASPGGRGSSPRTCANGWARPWRRW
jgi:DNA-binding SARP family transcriptional activator